jgi:hypothetical protein
MNDELFDWCTQKEDGIYADSPSGRLQGRWQVKIERTVTQVATLTLDAERFEAARAYGDLAIMEANPGMGDTNLDAADMMSMFWERRPELDETESYTEWEMTDIKCLDEPSEEEAVAAMKNGLDAYLEMSFADPKTRALMIKALCDEL